MSLFRTLSLRYLRKHRQFTALVVASIALGVALWVATGALNQSMEKALRRSATPLGGVADLYVSSGDAGVPHGLAARLRAVEGVKAARPLVLDKLQVEMPDRKYQPAMLLGLDVEDEGGGDPAAWGVEVSEMALLAYKTANRTAKFLNQKLAFVGRSLDDALPADARWLRVRCRGDDHSLIKVHTIDATGPAALLGGSVVVTDCETAAALLGRPGLVTRIDLMLHDAADAARVAEVRRRVEEVLERESKALRPEFVAALAANPAAAAPGNVPWLALAQSQAVGPAQVKTPNESDAEIRDVLSGLEVGFATYGVMALMVGVFLVYSAMSVSVNERRHDVGILRSVGATRGQVRGLFLAEALVQGLAGAAVGLPLGVGVAYLCLGPTQRLLSGIFLQVEGAALDVPTASLIGAALSGLGAAVAAALLASTRLAAEEPADVVRRVPPAAGFLTQSVQLGAAFFLAAAGVTLFAFKDRLPPRWGTHGGGVFVLLGALVTTPVLAAALARLAQPLFRRALPIEGRLAADNLVRAPGRTGLVITALAATVTLMVQTAGVIRSSSDGINDWLAAHLTPDLFVTSGGPLSSSGSYQPMGEAAGVELLRALREAEGPAPAGPRPRVVAVRDVFLDYRHRDGQTKVSLFALDADSHYQANRERGNDVPGLELFARLAREPGTAVVSDNFALQFGVRTGDTVTLPGATGPVALKVIGRVLDYSWVRGTVFVHRAHYLGQFDVGRAAAYYVYLPPGAAAEETRQRIQQSPWGADNALFVLKRDEVGEHYVGMATRVFSVAYPQEIAVGIVAALGVVAALLISVVQRRRELGLLRAVGATRAQVLRSVLAEALLVGALGTLIGLAFGLPLEWYVVRIVLSAETGYVFPFRVPWAEAGVIAGLALAAATLAGMLPALQAVRMRIADAVAYE